LKSRGATHDGPPTTAPRDNAGDDPVVEDTSLEGTLSQRLDGRRRITDEEFLLEQIDFYRTKVAFLETVISENASEKAFTQTHQSKRVHHAREKEKLNADLRRYDLRNKKLEGDLRALEAEKEEIIRSAKIPWTQLNGAQRPWWMMMIDDDDGNDDDDDYDYDDDYSLFVGLSATTRRAARLGRWGENPTGRLEPFWMLRDEWKKQSQI
jgi:hypothetical protein